MTMIKKNGVFEISLISDSSNIGNGEILKEVLVGIGIERKRIVECEQWPSTQLSIYVSKKSDANDLKKKISQLHLKKVSVTIKHLMKRDWQTKWKNGLKPFIISKTFGIVPVRMKKNFHFQKRTPIYIDTDLAFGTGLHATTRFMVQLIERCQGRFRNFLDIGTGTGILAVIAAKCDAEDITAIDISPEAVKVARSNFIKNQCARVNIRVADASKIMGKRQYDFVCANIITFDLIQMAEKLISLVKPGKYLAVSGISINSYDVFRQAYAQYPLRCLKIEKGEGWVAILYKKIITINCKKLIGCIRYFKIHLLLLFFH